MGYSSGVTLNANHFIHLIIRGLVRCCVILYICRLLHHGIWTVITNRTSSGESSVMTEGFQLRQKPPQANQQGFLWAACFTAVYWAFFPFSTVL